MDDRSLSSVEVSRRMAQEYDFVITSGGIGPTHDGTSMISVLHQDLARLTTFADITFASLAKAFNQPLVYHSETLARMTEASKTRKWASEQTAEQITARQRMALFPKDAEVLFVAKDIWVVCF
jgi:molybdopterin-biosynthesis enzyme MoeA-like protein